MNVLKSRVLSGVMITLLALITHPLAAREPTECRQVRFAEIGWSDITATTAVAMEISHALGYRPTNTLVSVPIAFSGVSNGDLDVFLGYWAPTMDEMIAPFLARGTLKVLPVPNLDGAKYTLAVPTYTFEAGLKSFQDLARFKEQLNGKIYAIEPGNDGNRAVLDMIERNLFDTGDFSLVESSEAGMLVQVQRAIRRQQPIVFLGWQPHPMNLQFAISYLDGGDQTQFGPNFGAAKIWTVIPTNYETRCPNMGRLLNNLQFTVDIESRLMERIVNKEDPRAVARDWLKNNPAWLERWLEGVSTLDGRDGLAALRQHLGQ